MIILSFNNYSNELFNVEKYFFSHSNQKYKIQKNVQDINFQKQIFFFLFSCIKIV